jgi:hypothetical protein
LSLVSYSLALPAKPGHHIGTQPDSELLFHRRFV